MKNHSTEDKERPSRIGARRHDAGETSDNHDDVAKHDPADVDIAGADQQTQVEQQQRRGQEPVGVANLE